VRDTALVLADLNGSQRHPERFSRRFTGQVARARRALGEDLLPAIRLHDLRHTHATLLLAAGEPVKVVSERLGHASATITLTVYQHVHPGMGRQAADRFAALLDRGWDAHLVLDGLEAERDQYGRRHLQRRLVLVPEGAPLPFRPDVELIDTPPSLDDAVPGIRRADGLVIPLTVDFQSVSALRWMLEYLHTTRDRQPELEIIGVQPTRLFPRRQAHLAFLEEITAVCERFAVPLLPPILEDASVCTFSLRGHLWAQLAERVLACAERAAARRLGLGHGG
jgi:hypothetical protein